MAFDKTYYPLMKNYQSLFLILLTLLFLPETVMAFFLSKNLDANEFLALVNELLEGSSSERQIKRITLENQGLPDKPLENIHFKSCKWESVDAHEKTLKNIIFEDCELNNINMRSVNLVNVQFIKSRLTNVVMNNAHLEQVKFKKSKLISTDSNIMNNYRNLIADEIVFENSELTGINFFESKAIIRFNNSKLYDVSGVGLMTGSAVYIYKTRGSILDFDQSDLTDMEVIDSTIDKQSSAGGGNIQSIRVENSKLEFALGYTSNIESAVFENSGDVVIGGGKNNNTFTIKNCPKDTYVINAGGGVDKLEIENCHVSAIRFTDSTGKYISLKNVSTYSMDFRDSKIENLILDNVSVRGKIEYTKTQLDKLEQNNLSFGKKIDIYREGSNLEIKPDIILEK